MAKDKVIDLSQYTLTDWPEGALLFETARLWQASLTERPTQWHLHSLLSDGFKHHSEFIKATAIKLLEITNGQEVYMKPYGPKGEQADGDITVSMDSTAGFAFDATLTAKTGTTTLSKSCKILAPEYLYDKI